MEREWFWKASFDTCLSETRQNTFLLQCSERPGPPRRSTVFYSSFIFVIENGAKSAPPLATTASTVQLSAVEFMRLSDPPLRSAPRHPFACKSSSFFLQSCSVYRFVHLFASSFLPIPIRLATDKSLSGIARFNITPIFCVANRTAGGTVPRIYCFRKFLENATKARGACNR